MRQRTSPIWKLPSNEFKKLILSNKTYGQVLKFFGLKNHGSNGRNLKSRIRKEGIDDSHIRNYTNSSQHRAIYIKKIPLDKILVENSTYSNRQHLRHRLVSAGLLKDECAICHLPPLWKDKKLTLVLDHKNGINDDYRIENLRLLCPNCNSQTDTFCGRTKKRVYNYCIDCGKEIKGRGKTGLCHACLIKKNIIPAQPRKFEVSKEELEKMVWEKPVTKVAEIFKVSGNAIKKRCKLMQIPVPPRGYWMKRLHGKI
jgi:hypothetical protein